MELHLIKLLHEIVVPISKVLVIAAEVSLWAFVAVGVVKVASNGVKGVSSLLLTCSLVMMSLSLILCLIGKICDYITQYRETANAIRGRED